MTNEKNKINDAIFFNQIIIKNRKNKKETKAEKKERIRIRGVSDKKSVLYSGIILPKNPTR